MSIFTAGRHSNTVFEASQQSLASTDSLYMCSPTGWQVVACRCKEVTLLQWKTSLWFLRSPVVCTNTDQRVLKQWKVWCKAETVKVKLFWNVMIAAVSPIFHFELCAFLVCVALFWEELGSVCRQVGVFQANYGRSKQSQGDFLVFVWGIHVFLY